MRHVFIDINKGEVRAAKFSLPFILKMYSTESINVWKED